MSSKLKMLVQLRQQGTRKVFAVANFLNSDPLCNIEFYDDDTVDETLAKMREVHTALLENAIEQIEQRDEFDDDCEDDEEYEVEYEEDESEC